ncbi:hypothetical protein [Haloferula sp. A504]|uniref:hypothetical protein n=1 Tax=Haloferula sp. A504 TaxID=3373601 RepID=UPI0031BEFEBA|nr:hypothetical protein [Verrucomicrobiaceae bacterium E54]
MTIGQTLIQQLGLVGAVGFFMALSFSRRKPVTENLGVALVACYVVIARTLWIHALLVYRWEPGDRVLDGSLAGWPLTLLYLGGVSGMVLIGLAVHVLRQDYRIRQKIAFLIGTLIQGFGVYLAIRVPFEVEAALTLP